LSAASHQHSTANSLHVAEQPFTRWLPSNLTAREE
jgi:hypothetical protein